MDSTKTVELLSNEVVAYQDENQTLVNELKILVERNLKIYVMHFLSFLNFF